MKITTLEEAFLEELKDLYDAEHQLLEALPKMARAAKNKELKAGFTEHLQQTEGHVARLEQAFELLEEQPKRQTCKAMKGLLAEGSEIIEEDAAPAVHDAFLIAAAQKVEHYEIATYGTLCAWAETIGRDDLHAILHETHLEEVETDEKLTALAQKGINAKAAL